MFDPKEDIEDEIDNKTEDDNTPKVVEYLEDEWDNICGDIVNFK